MDLVPVDDHDAMSLKVRMFVANELHQMLAALRPYINGDFGDVQPGHVQAAVRVLHELGAQWQTQSRPYEKPQEKGISPDKVAAMLQEQEARHQRELEVAVEQAAAAAREQVRLELEQRERLSLEAARTDVLKQLSAVAVR